MMIKEIYIIIQIIIKIILVELRDYARYIELEASLNK